MNGILKLILMNPRVTLGITVATTAACLGLALLMSLASAKIDSLQAQLDAANTTIAVQTEAAKGIAALADARADVAAQAIEAAAQAGRADRRAAEVYLNLPTPAPADRCEAAQVLIDDAIREEN
jgi:hypothetical protein